MTTQEEWKEECRVKFFSKGYAAEIYLADLESFISSLLSAQKKELAGKVEAMDKSMPTIKLPAFKKHMLALLSDTPLK